MKLFLVDFARCRRFVHGNHQMAVVAFGNEIEWAVPFTNEPNVVERRIATLAPQTTPCAPLGKRGRATDAAAAMRGTET